MKCIKCGSKEFVNGFCRKHFIENIEKRVKKDIRQNIMIKRKENLVVKDALSRHFIKEVLNVPVNIGRKGREALAWTMDDEILEFLTAIFRAKKVKKTPKRVIKLFRTVKDSELEAYAKLKNIRFSIKRTKQEKGILKEMDKLEKDHKETRFSLLKSIEEIKGL